MDSGFRHTWRMQLQASRSRQRLTPCSHWPGPTHPLLLRSPAVQSPFAPVLWVLFVTTGIFTLVIAIGIRLLFRRGKSITDL
jgi:hypothetical protein